MNEEKEKSEGSSKTQEKTQERPKEETSKTQEREKTGYWYCPECGQVFTLKGLSSHIRNKEPELEWNEVKDDWR